MPSWGSSSPVDPTTRSVAPVASPRRHSRSDAFLGLVSIGAMAQTLQRTPIHDRHVALGARMVPFAGWAMPVQYEGAVPEVGAVRTDAGVFDVWHMGELEVEGPRATELLQATLSNDLQRIAPGQAQYTLLTNERGGIIDDLIVYKLDDFRYLLIVNAANRNADFAWLQEREIPG